MKARSVTKPVFHRLSIEKIYSSWIRSVSTRECLSILNIPKRDQLYRIGEFMRFCDSSADYRLLVLDLKGEAIEDRKDLLRYMEEYGFSDSGKTILLVLDADQLLEEKTALVSVLDSLYFERRTLSIIYFFQKNITAGGITREYSPYTSLYQNISLYRNFGKPDLMHFAKSIAAEYSVKMPKKLADKIVRELNGSPWLIKEAIRYYSQTGDAAGIFSHHGLRTKLRIIWQEFSDTEKSVLEKTVLGEKGLDQAESESADYLFKIGTIETKNGRIKIVMPALEDYVCGTVRSKTDITVTAGKLTVNKVIIDSFFTGREKKLLRHFILNRMKTIPRESAAEVVWELDGNNEYSDWALDQIIKRLRTKLSRLGIPADTLKTRKNVGYVYE